MPKVVIYSKDLQKETADMPIEGYDNDTNPVCNVPENILARYKESKDKTPNDYKRV